MCNADIRIVHSAEIRSAHNAEIRLAYNTEISHVQVRDWSFRFLDNATIRIVQDANSISE